MKTSTKAAKTQPNPAAKGYAAIYCRVSTTDQGDKFSLPSQLKRLREMAAGDGYTVKSEHEFKDEFSGKTASRPNFERLRALVKTGTIQAVLVLSVDRFARRVEDAAATFAEFKRHGVLLDFAEMRMEDSASSRFMFNAMCAMAEYQGEKIVTDSKRGSRQKLERGLLTHGSAPYGYKYIDKRQKDGSRFEIDDRDSSVPGLSRIKVVRDIYEWRRSGIPTYRIAKRLHEMGVLSAGRAGRGGIWTRQGVLKLLGNPSYVGRHTVGGIVVPCPALIDESLWCEVQRINKETREKYTGRPPKGRYLLRSLLFCGKCARRCLGTSSKARYYYRCGNLLRVPYIRKCDAPEVRADRIEAIAWNSIWGLLKNPTLLLQLGQAYYDGLPNPEGGGAQALEREAAQLTQRIKTTRQMVRDSGMDYAEGLAAIRADDQRIRQIEQELAAAGRVISLPPLHAAEAALREITTGAEPKTYERRRLILEGILDLRVNYYDGDLEITGKVPMPDVAVPAGSGKKKCNKPVSAIGG